jgi:hypothetical protein
MKEMKRRFDWCWRSRLWCKKLPEHVRCTVHGTTSRQKQFHDWVKITKTCKLTRTAMNGIRSWEQLDLYYRNSEIRFFSCDFRHVQFSTILSHLAPFFFSPSKFKKSFLKFYCYSKPQREPNFFQNRNTFSIPIFFIYKDRNIILHF